jgi:hypothetical protein
MLNENIERSTKMQLAIDTAILVIVGHIRLNKPYTDIKFGMPGAAMTHSDSEIAFMA